MFLAAAILACSLASIDPNAPVANPVVCSPNGRFCAVLRLDPAIPDFTATVRAASVDPPDYLEGSEQNWDLQPPAVPDPPSTTTAALYDARRRLLVEIPLPVETLDEVLVPDSGRFLVAVEHTFDLCGSGVSQGSVIAAVYRADGSKVGQVTMSEVMSAWDHEQMRHAAVRYTLRREWGGRELLVIAVPGPNGAVERRVDLDTAKVIDPNTPIYPPPGIRVRAMTAADVRRSLETPLPDCEAGFRDPAVVHLESEEILRRAISQPLPEYPVIALKALVTGPVQVDVLVSEWGEVACVASSPLPFGMSAAARNAAGQWRFRPLFVDGRRVPFHGQAVFDFTR